MKPPSDVANILPAAPKRLIAHAGAVLFVLGVTLAAVWWPIPGLTQHDTRWCLIIFAAAAALWMTELIPPFATAILVVVLCVYTLGHPAIARDGGADAWQAYFNPVASPVLAIFFAGFILAISATRHKLDVVMGSVLLKPFGHSPVRVLLGVLCITALFSMFMSNTATTAMMLAVLGPVVRRDHFEMNLRKRLMLGTAFAANVGGVGTIIGTPPNAVAASFLNQIGEPISFLSWLMFGGPIAAVLLLVLWGLLIVLYPIRTQRLQFAGDEPLPAWTPSMVVVLVTFVVTVVMWMTEPLHGLPAAVVALLPIAAFTVTGVVTRDDLRRVDWDVLILLVGGLTLGKAMVRTELSQVLVALLPFEGVSPFGVLVIFAVVTVVLSNFMSNTGAANILLPIGMSMAQVAPRDSAIVVALCASLAMSLPISTPPNAMAFASGTVTTRDLLLCGTLMSIIGLGVVLTAVRLFL